MIKIVQLLVSPDLYLKAKPHLPRCLCVMYFSQAVNLKIFFLNYSPSNFTYTVYSS